MKITVIVGIVLIIIGVAAFGYQGISYTSREKIVDLGPLEITTDRTRTFPLPPLVGGISLAAGIILLVMGSRKTSEV
ncbi:Sigma54-dependent transcriptional regulator [Desulfonema limicola]|uniref:Sigma54-dependent transcriptional regulator n=1 Tax=Desulfonema limicola TaxID=45656 RepID=A0A975BAM2_9BACT|nr:DUF3185 domain-containing protein [Desulfonema limicola]QTA81846.1 Sigma54-dependent transcriptional regulator [Desulfonema limicola]